MGCVVFVNMIDNSPPYANSVTSPPKAQNPHLLPTADLDNLGYSWTKPPSTTLVSRSARRLWTGLGGQSLANVKTSWNGSR